MAEERLQKILSRAGISSRRAAETLILEGRVQVNGEAVHELGTRADPRKDVIRVDEQVIAEPEDLVYYVLYKPERVVTTLSDPEGRQAVGDLIRRVKERVYPVGRLDYDAEGVLLLTNDGELAHKLTHPRWGVRRTYLAKVKGEPADAVLERMKEGVRLEDGMARAVEATFEKRTPKNTWIRLVVAEGRHHLVKRLCEAVGHPVVRLYRSDYAGVTAEGLAPGGVRLLTPKEIHMLRMAVAKEAPLPPGGRRRKPARVSPVGGAVRNPITGAIRRPADGGGRGAFGSRPGGGRVFGGGAPARGGFGGGGAPARGGFGRGGAERGGFDRGEAPARGGFGRGGAERGSFSRGEAPARGGFGRGGDERRGGFDRGEAPARGGFGRGGAERGGFGGGEAPARGGFSRGGDERRGGFGRGEAPARGGFRRGGDERRGGFGGGEPPARGGFSRGGAGRGSGEGFGGEGSGGSRGFARWAEEEGFSGESGSAPREAPAPRAPRSGPARSGGARPQTAGSRTPGGRPRGPARGPSREGGRGGPRRGR